MAEKTHIPVAQKVNLARKRLLFVDDEAPIRATLPVILRRYGFTITVAATVAEAIQQIQIQEFDLLLCDLNIEREADGYEVVRAMQKANPTCAVMILTAYPGVDSAVEGIHLQIEDYIIKPTNADALVALLAEKLLAPRIQNLEHLAPTDSEISTDQSAHRRGDNRRPN
jgi:DNA-binding NtrC family response regulator